MTLRMILALMVTQWPTHTRVPVWRSWQRVARGRMAVVLGSEAGRVDSGTPAQCSHTPSHTHPRRHTVTRDTRGWTRSTLAGARVSRYVAGHLIHVLAERAVAMVTQWTRSTLPRSIAVGAAVHPWEAWSG